MSMTEIQAVQNVTKILLDSSRDYNLLSKNLSTKPKTKIVHETNGFKEDEDSQIKFLYGTDIWCEKIERALSETKKIQTVTAKWNVKKDTAFKGLVSILELISQLSNSQANFLKVSVPESKSGKILSNKVIGRLEKLANEIDDIVENLELIIEFYNKVEGNELQAALDRIEDKEDPVITTAELRKLLGL